MTEAPLAKADAVCVSATMNVSVMSFRIRGSGLALRHADHGESGEATGRPGGPSVGDDVAHGGCCTNVGERPEVASSRPTSPASRRHLPPRSGMGGGDAAAAGARRGGAPRLRAV